MNNDVKNKTINKKNIQKNIKNKHSNGQIKF